MHTICMYIQRGDKVQSTIGNIGDVEEQQTQDDDVVPPKKRRRYFIT